LYNTKETAMKKGFILMLSIAWSMAVMSQERTNACSYFYSHVLVDMGYSTSAAENGGMRARILYAHIGWKPIEKLGVFASFEGTTGFGDDINGAGNYYRSNSIGGGVKYLLINEHGRFLPKFNTLTLHVKCGSTIGNNAWKYTLYETGLTLNLRKRLSPTFGLGYRVLDSRTPGINNHKGLFATIGISL
jgi:hypothetical protein